MSDERRIHRRTPVRLLVEYENVEDFLMDYTSNVSIGGMFIRTDDPMPMGARFKMRFRIPDRDGPVEANGEVCWVVPVRPDATHIQAGMGIRFSDIDESDRESIEAMLQVWALREEEEEEEA